MLIIPREDNLFSHIDKKSKRETFRVLVLHSRYFKRKEKLRERGTLLLYGNSSKSKTWTLWLLFNARGFFYRFQT